MDLRHYPGAKNGAGVFQQIISAMPPHEVYIEPFLGTGAVVRRKRPARSSIVIDRDAAAVDAFDSSALPGCIAIVGDGSSFLKRYPWTGQELVYCDPPYLKTVRSCKEDYYKHEFTDDDHRSLLAILADLGSRWPASPARPLTPAASADRASDAGADRQEWRGRPTASETASSDRQKPMVMISGYWSELYAEMLSGWRTLTFWTVKRNGERVQEWIWMNFPEPFELHDYRYLGRNFRERERINRKKRRWAARILAMSAAERGAVIEAIAEARACCGAARRE